MSRIELHRLRYFVAVAEELNFSRAALRLNIAQPPLSLQIQKLEAEIGVTLLLRTKKRCELTFAGQMFLKEARATLAQAAHAIDVARRASRGEVGELTIGYTASADLSVLTKIVPVFRERFPDARLEFRSLFHADQIAKLHDETIDVGILRLPLHDEDDVEVMPILREHFVAVLPEKHRLAMQKTVKIEDIRGETYIIFPRRFSPGMYDTITSAFHRHGLSPEISEIADHIQFNLSLVAMGEGVSFLPESVRVLQREGVVYVPLQDTSIITELGILYRKNDQSQMVDNLLQLAREIFPPSSLRL